MTLADVERATGFELRVADDVATVPEPSPAELAAVRAVDPLGVRRSEFGPEDLARTFGAMVSAG